MATQTTTRKRGRARRSNRGFTAEGARRAAALQAEEDAARAREMAAVPLGEICAVCSCCFNPALDACPRCAMQMQARLQAISDTWDVLDDEFNGGMNLNDLRAVAKKLSLPYLGVLLVNCFLTSEDLEEWEQWAPRTQLLTICRIEGDSEAAKSITLPPGTKEG